MKKIVLLLTLTPLFVWAGGVTNTTRQEIPLKNLLGENGNGGFESYTMGWTASGGNLDAVTSGSNLLIGSGSGTWDSSAAAQTLRSRTITIPNGLYGVNGVVRCLFQTPSGTATHTIGYYNGTTSVIGPTITSSTSPSISSFNFQFPSSGTIALEITSVASNEPLIAIDECFMGAADGVNVGNSIGAQFVGSAYIATTASCTWTRTNTALGSFGTTAACPGPTVEFNPGPGTIQTTDTDLPKFTVNNLPAGRYVVHIMAGAKNNTGVAAMAFAINDGSTTSGQVSANSATGTGASHVVGFFNYTTPGNHTFELYGSAASNGIVIDNNVNQQQTYFYIERFPSVPETTYTPDKMANAWSGYHDSTCSWSRTNTAIGDPTADASCALVEVVNLNFGTVSTSGSVLPKIVFTPSRPGTYFVCAIGNWEGATTNAQLDIRLTDGTTVIAEGDRTADTGGNWDQFSLCGLYKALTTSSVTLAVQDRASSGAVVIATGGVSRSAIEWSIFQADVSIPAPLLVNSVVNTASSVEVINRATIANSGTCSITSQNGSWLTSVSHPATGKCALVWPSGNWSAAPSCSLAGDNAPMTFFASAGSPTTTGATVNTKNTAGTDTDLGFEIICMGPK